MKPRKKRDVLFAPGASYFKPRGIPMVYLDIVSLTIDEYESIRLADLEDLKHDDAAKHMNISRPTFTRLLESAHKKISDAIVNGKAISISGGDYRILGKRMRCRKCGFFWNYEDIEGREENIKCSQCDSTDIEDIAEKLNIEAVDRPCRHRHGQEWGKK